MLPIAPPPGVERGAAAEGENLHFEIILPLLRFSSNLKNRNGWRAASSRSEFLENEKPRKRDFSGENGALFGGKGDFRPKIAKKSRVLSEKRGEFCGKLGRKINLLPTKIKLSPTKIYLRGV
ncbi:MAG: hypothetical protein HUK09_05405 [Bacteroidaceae bacterium]|nr:hypothetical protein [Bacteroidaceae bacterium]